MKESAAANRGTRIAIHAMVATGGLAALSWEVLWQLEATLALGLSAQGTAITLATTMAGITVGSLLAGRWLRDHPPHRPIRLYGVLEAVIGVSGLLMRPGFAFLEWLDTAVYAASPGLAPPVHALGIAILLGPPTLAMGASVPAFAQIARSHRTSVAALYGINTLGASAGVLLIAFALIPTLGVSQTCLLVALLNLLVFAGTRFFDSGKKESVASDAAPHAPPRISRTVAGIVVFCTGFVTFGLEIAWFRSLRAAFGSVTESFAIMLAAVLIPLGIGARLVPRLRQTDLQPATYLVLAGALILVATPFVERMDMLANAELPYGALLGWRFGLAIAILGPSMLLLGIVLPWLLAEFGDPERCGWLYGINTAGAVFGSLLAAWIFLPWLGFARTAWLLGTVVALLATTLAVARARWIALAVGTAALGIAVTQTSSLGRDRVPGIEASAGTRIIAFEEGPDSTVSVVARPNGVRLLVIDGFIATSQNLEGEYYMQLMGRLPMLLHPDPKSALVICFGTGQTANALREEGPESLDIVELNPDVLAMARHFASNRGVLDDERVRAIAMDGRAWLRRSDRLYDVITLEPMPPLFAGVNALYSREFYELVAQRLEPGGIVAQWLPLHIMPPFHAASAAAAFQVVFPDAILWIQPNDSSGILLGRRDGPVSASLGEEWPGLARRKGGSARLKEQISAAVALDPAALSRYADLGTPVTDDNQLLAYGSLDALLDYGGTLTPVNLGVIREVARGTGSPRLPGPSDWKNARASDAELIETLERLRSWDSDELSLHLMLTILYERQGHHEAAGTSAQRSLAIEPDLTADQAALLVPGLATLVGPEDAATLPDLLRRAGFP